MKLFSRLQIHHLIVVCIFFELLLYSQNFIRLRPETELLPSKAVAQQLTDLRGERKVNSLNHGADDYTLNSGVALNTENLNGYNPIFSRRLLWAVNAVEGRPADHVESVSLNLSKRDHYIYQLAGVNVQLLPDGEIKESTPAARVFYEWQIKDDAEVFKLIEQEQVSANKPVIYLKQTDKEVVTGEANLSPCPTVPEVKLDYQAGLNLAVKAECEFFYVLPYSYLVGWQAATPVGARPAFPAFGFLQAYQLPPGEYVAVLTYRPAPVRLFFK